MLQATVQSNVYCSLSALFKHKGLAQTFWLKYKEDLHQPICSHQSQHCSIPSSKDWQPRKWLWNQFSIHQYDSLRLSVFFTVTQWVEEKSKSVSNDSFHKSPFPLTIPPVGVGKTTDLVFPPAHRTILCWPLASAAVEEDVCAITYRYLMQ